MSGDILIVHGGACFNPGPTHKEWRAIDRRLRRSLKMKRNRGRPIADVLTHQAMLAMRRWGRRSRACH